MGEGPIRKWSMGRESLENDVPTMAGALEETAYNG